MASSKLADIFHFQATTETLGTAGQPTSAQFEAVKDAGYEVVINLALGNTPRDLASEPELISELGLDYIHIPVVFDQPTEADLQQFFEAMEANQGKKCFVHCIANARVSAFVMLYRVIRQGVPLEEAQAMMHEIWTPNEIWQAFIDKTLAQHGAGA